MRGTRELSGPGFTEAAGVGLLRRHKAGFEAEIQGWFFLTDRMQFSYLRWSIEVLERREFQKCQIKLKIVPSRSRSSSKITGHSNYIVAWLEHYWVGRGSNVVTTLNQLNQQIFINTLHEAITIDRRLNDLQ